MSMTDTDGIQNVLPGEWVILENNEIIEHDQDARVILAKAKRYGGRDIIISKEPSGQNCFY
jgi:hypothetical protein